MRGLNPAQVQMLMESVASTNYLLGSVIAEKKYYASLLKAQTISPNGYSVGSFKIEDQKCEGILSFEITTPKENHNFFFVAETRQVPAAKPKAFFGGQ